MAKKKVVVPPPKKESTPPEKCACHHNHKVRRNSPSSSSERYCTDSSDSSSYSDDYDCYMPDHRECDFYTETVDIIDPLQREYSSWLFIQTPLTLEKVKQTFKNAKKLHPKILYYIIRQNNEKKYDVLVKFKEDVDENEIMELRAEYKNTYSYVFFPYPRFDLILGYMETHAAPGSEFLIDGEYKCDLDIKMILKNKKIASDLKEENTRRGYDTPGNVILDKLIRVYIDENGGPEQALSIIKTGDFLDKFGKYGVECVKALYS